MSSMMEANVFDLAAYSPAVLQHHMDGCRQAYEQHRHRIYSLAFWMTGSELQAEELMTRTFCRVFRKGCEPTAEEIDRALIAELRRCISLGTFTLACAPATEVLSVRRNPLRVELERAVVQLPPTEKMIFLLHDVENYPHPRITALLRLTEDESRRGLHQARLRIRELLAN